MNWYWDIEISGYSCDNISIPRYPNINFQWKKKPSPNTPRKKGYEHPTSPLRTLKDTLLDIIREHGGEMTYEKMNDIANERLEKTLDGQPMWYIVTVKLDLEARGIFQRVPKTSPHVIRLAK